MSKRSPRLTFTDDEIAAPELKKSIGKANKAAVMLEKAEAKIPKNKLTHTEKKPPSKLAHAIRDAPINVLSAQFHREMHESERDNVGVESAHKIEAAAEAGARLAQSAHRSSQLKPYRAAERAEVKADKANIKALNKEAQYQNPQFNSNPYSRWQQKRAIKKEYAAVKAGRNTANTVKSSEIAAKAADRTKKTGEFISRHKKGFLIVGAIALVIVLLMNIISSCSVMFQGGMGALQATTYPSSDEEIQAAEAAYTAKEAALQGEIDNYEAIHSGCDEYRYSLDAIGHDPHILTAILSAIHGEYTLADVQSTLDALFSAQYMLTENVTTETRYRTESRTGYYTVQDPNTGQTSYVPYTYTVQVPYTYRICTVTLENVALESLVDTLLTDEQKTQYEIYTQTQGNRPDLFGEGEP